MISKRPSHAVRRMCPALILAFVLCLAPAMQAEEGAPANTFAIEAAGGTAYLSSDEYSLADYNAILSLGVSYGGNFHLAGFFTAQRIYEHPGEYTNAYGQSLGSFRPNLNNYSFELLGGYRRLTFARLRPFVRMGVALSRMSYEHDFMDIMRDGTKTGFVARMGADYRLTRRISLSLSGRWFMTRETGLDNNWKYIFNTARRQFGVLGGIAVAI